MTLKDGALGVKLFMQFNVITLIPFKREIDMWRGAYFRGSAMIHSKGVEQLKQRPPNFRTPLPTPIRYDPERPNSACVGERCVSWGQSCHHPKGRGPSHRNSIVQYCWIELNWKMFIWKTKIQM